MRFPETPRDGDQVHASAVRRLDQARDEQRRLSDRLTVAEGTSSESSAARELAAGRADVASREAWLVWVERGV